MALPAAFITNALGHLAVVLVSLLVFSASGSKSTPLPHSSHTGEVWNFLVNYGYLPESDNNSLNLISDHEFKKAVISMQKYANIPQTGILDTATIRKMKAPGCGLPDIEPTEARSTRSKRFVVYGPKWTKSPITWSLVQPSRKVPTQMARENFRQAFALWASASSKLLFKETAKGGADIEIGFYTGQHAGCSPRQAFDGKGTKLAHAYSPPHGDVHFDDDEDWMNETEGLSLYWTALHEFGHSLGFAHTADERSIMFPYYQDHGSNFQLPEIDKAGIRFLYGDSFMPNNNPEDKLPIPANRPVDEGTTVKSEESEKDEQRKPCNTNIDAIASIRGEIFVFKGNVFWWLKQGLHLVRKEPIPISQYFVGFPTDIEKVDAVYERKSDQKIMFFVGKQYWLFSANKYHSGPRPITDLGLPPDLDSIDAITNWGHNGRAFIFSGSIYWKLDETEQKVEVDYPRDMSVWKGVPIHIDAAFTWQFDSSTYFFKGNRFWKFNNQQMKTDENYPKLIQEFWFREFYCTRLAKNAQVFNLERIANWSHRPQHNNLWSATLGLFAIWLAIR